MANVHSYTVSNNGNDYVSENFQVKEFACHDGTDFLQIDLELIPILQRFRQYVECPVIINSAFRTKSYNEQVGGASNSFHLYGRAFDVDFSHDYNYLTSPSKMADFFNTLKVNGIIKYDWGNHIDTRDYEYHANGDGELLSFGKVNIPLYDLIMYGQNKNDVGVLQFILKRIGYNIDVDCQFGNDTLNAVKDYQSKHNLDIDGIVGQNTWNSLLY